MAHFLSLSDDWVTIPIAQVTDLRAFPRIRLERSGRSGPRGDFGDAGWRQGRRNPQTRPGAAGL